MVDEREVDILMDTLNNHLVEAHDNFRETGQSPVAKDPESKAVEENLSDVLLKEKLQIGKQKIDKEEKEKAEKEKMGKEKKVGSDQKRLRGGGTHYQGDRWAGEGEIPPKRQVVASRGSVAAQEIGRFNKKFSGTRNTHITTCNFIKKK